MLHVGYALKKRIEKLVGTTPYDKVYIVHNGVHRKYLDVNRKPECAYDSDNEHAKQIYDVYHMTIENYINDIRDNHKYGLLVDVHGQSSKEGDIFIGNFTEPLVVDFLVEKGYDVVIDEWKGGYTVSNYDNINSIQLEIDKKYRFDIENRKQVIKDLSSMIIKLINNKKEYLYLK